MTAGPLSVAPTFIDLVRARAARHIRRIVFPESADVRVRSAIQYLARERIVEPVVILDPAAPDTHDAVSSLGVETIDPERDARAERTVADLLARRSRKGLTEDAARECARHPLFFADAMVSHGEADGCVAGSVCT